MSEGIYHLLHRTLAAFIMAGLATYAFGFLIRRIAVRFSVLDQPEDERKTHGTPVPLLGGVAILLGILLAAAISQRLEMKEIPILAWACVMLIINVIDDIRGLSARFRIAAEVLISLGLIYSGVRISFLPVGLIGSTGEVIITVIWLVGLINAFNYLDGMDGLAAGSAAVNGFLFALILNWTGQFELSSLALMLSGACLGFLPHNFRRKKMFLGDGGSTFLGIMVAAIGVSGHWASDSIVKVSIPILILGVPIFDMTFTTIMRVKEGKVRNIVEWMKYAGRDHFHHYLESLGFSKIRAVIFIWAVTLVLGLGAVMVTNDQAWEGLLTVFQALMIFGMIGLLMVAGRRRGED